MISGIGIFDVLKQMRDRSFLDFSGIRQDFLIHLIGVLIDLTDGRTGDDIVELKLKYRFPTVIKCFSVLRRTQNIGERREPFRLGEGKFTLAVITFIMSLRSISAAMIFKIQFAVPNRYFPNGLILISLDIFMKTIEELSGTG